MPLPTFDSKDAIPEAFRDAYVEKEGKWIPAPNEDVEGLKTNHRRVLDEKKKLEQEFQSIKGALGDAKPEEVAEILKAHRASEEERSKKAGEFDKILEKRLNELRTEYEPKVKAGEEAIRKLEDYEFDRFVREAALAGGVSEKDLRWPTDVHRCRARPGGPGPPDAARRVRDAAAGQHRLLERPRQPGRHGQRLDPVRADRLRRAPTAAPVTPGATCQPVKAPIPLNKWRQVGLLPDRQAARARSRRAAVEADGEAVKALAEDINAFIFSKYKKVYGFAGTPGTTPFATDVTGRRRTRAVLNRQLAPMTDRRIVLDVNAEANALGAPADHRLAERREGRRSSRAQIGRKSASTGTMDQQIPTHTSTPLTAGAATVNGVHAISAGLDRQRPHRHGVDREGDEHRRRSSRATSSRSPATRRPTWCSRP
jgi:hypothetical protein